MSKPLSWIVAFATVFFACLHASPARAETFEIFDVPDKGTSPYGSIKIDAAGNVAGSADGAIFYRSASGNITWLEVPGALASYLLDMNPSGLVVGNFEMPNPIPDPFYPFVYQGFIFDTQRGNLTVFSVPGASSTILYLVTPSGLIYGQADDYYFLRAPNGTITYLDFPYFFYAINDSAVATGAFLQSQYNYTAYVRQADGTVQQFDVPPVPSASEKDTIVTTGINASGTVVGYANSGLRVGYNERAFVRSSDGTFRIFRVTDGNRQIRSPYTITANAINDAGWVVGSYSNPLFEGEDSEKGYLRAPAGRVTRFQVPGMFRTLPSAVNASNVVTGQCVDSAGYHGFIRKP